GSPSVMATPRSVGDYLLGRPGLLAGLSRTGGAPRRLGLSLFLCHVALSLRLVLLGTALVAETVVADHDPDDLFGLTDNVLDDALDTCHRPTVGHVALLS